MNCPNCKKILDFGDYKIICDCGVALFVRGEEITRTNREKWAYNFFLKKHFSFKIIEENEAKILKITRDKIKMHHVIERMKEMKMNYNYTIEFLLMGFDIDSNLYGENIDLLKLIF
jgi:hypothetical protein